MLPLKTPTSHHCKPRVAQQVSICMYSRPCPSFPCFLGKSQGKPPKKQGFFIPTEPLKSLEKKGKTLEKTRKSSQGEKTRKSKKTRKGRTGKVLGKKLGASESFLQVSALTSSFLRGEVASVAPTLERLSSSFLSNSFSQHKFSLLSLSKPL